MALRSRGCVQSRKTNVDRCKTGNVGINRTKNIWRHSSRKTELTEVASTAEVTVDD